MSKQNIRVTDQTFLFFMKQFLGNRFTKYLGSISQILLVKTDDRINRNSVICTNGMVVPIQTETF